MQASVFVRHLGSFIFYLHLHISNVEDENSSPVILTITKSFKSVLVQLKDSTH